MRAGIMVLLSLAGSLSAGCVVANPLFLPTASGTGETTGDAGTAATIGAADTGETSLATGEPPTGGSITEAETGEPTSGEPGETGTTGEISGDTTSSSTTDPGMTGGDTTGEPLADLPVCEIDDVKLVACYDFEFQVDDPNQFIDSSKYGNHGILLGPHVIDGVEGQALAIGPDTTLEVTPKDPSLSPTTALTMSAWVRLADSMNKNRYVINKQTEYYLRVTPAGFQCGVGPYQLIIELDPPLPQGQWFHLACVHTQGTTTAYLDGAFVGNIVKPAVDLPASTNVLTLGCGPDCTPDTRLDGSLDAVRLWSVGLGVAEILHQAGKS